MRPEPPLQQVWSDILHACWHRDPAVRPAFTEIDKQVQQLRAKFGADLKESPAPRPSVLDEQMRTRKSPDMHPIPLPLLPRARVSRTRSQNMYSVSGHSGHDGVVRRGRLGTVDGCLLHDRILALRQRARR